SVDGLRELIDNAKAGKPIDKSSISELQQLFGTLDDQPAPAPQESKSTDEDSSAGGWRISFHPHENLLRTGNEPYRLLRELQKLGKLRVTADLTQLPDFSNLDPESCYVGWDMYLQGATKREEILEVFDWVQGDCDLEITLEGDRRQRTDRREDVEEAKFGRRESDYKGSMTQEATSIRVDIDKVDGLVNLVGELVITQSMLSRFEDNYDPEEAENLKTGLVQLARNTRELQEQTLQIRMLPIDFAFQRLPRLVHDLGRALGKKAELKTTGEKTELDKTVLEKIGDPLVHLIRNAIDHGIESPDDRIAAGKPESGTINLSAYHEGGNIIIDVKDDGGGLNVEKILKKARSLGIVGENETLPDEQVHNLIFHPGFTTVAEVSDVSGRGVGMDVVKKNITDLGGHVEVSSEKGKGSIFTIRLPLTLAILDGQLVGVGDQIYIIPLLSIIESVQMGEKDIKAVAGKAKLYNFRDEYIPIIRLFDFGNKGSGNNDNLGVLVVVDVGLGKQRVGLHIDEILGQQQVVIKSLETNFRQIQGLSGATILGDGTVALILDLHGLVQRYLHGDKDLSMAKSEQQISEQETE
ncbi:MAG: chemotaxis protein CheA, partial [Gammaproteobacteria bacterium]